jgi:uncharacterized protein (DUF433 family)
MDELDSFVEEHIVLDPAILHGKPSIRGTRVPVTLILNLMAHGSTVEEIVDAYPYVNAEDIKASLLYAQRVLEKVRAEALAS